MGLFFGVSTKELLEIRNKIFVESGIPALRRNGFTKSPFLGIWYGKDNLGDYAYELCRLTTNSHLEIVSVYISSGDDWIKIYLNIFELKPHIESLEQLNSVDGLQFHLPPNSITKMRLRIDDYTGIPLFRAKEHKIRFYYSKHSLKQRIEELSELIENDLDTIDFFVKRWFEKHQPLLTTWEGYQIEV